MQKNILQGLLFLSFGYCLALPLNGQGTIAGDCDSIEVTGGSSTTAGVYMRTEAFANDAPRNPVWKHSKNDRYIFNTGSSTGWRIGQEVDLSNGAHYYKSQSKNLPYDYEKWENEDGSRIVEVKCQKSYNVESSSTCGEIYHLNPKDIVEGHNDWRRKVESGEAHKYKVKASNMNMLSWDSTLAQEAQNWADECTTEHSPEDDRGENIFRKGFKTNDISFNAGLEATEAWASEREVTTKFPSYLSSFPTNQFIQGAIGHWTQMIWAKTTKIGCGAIKIKRKWGKANYQVIVVCKYSKPGNTRGEAAFEHE